MVILTLPEVADLREHLAERPDLWLRHASREVWFRRTDRDNYALVLCIRASLSDLEGMAVLTHKPLLWSAPTAQEYIEWLLTHYTAFGVRSQIIRVLRTHHVSHSVEHTLSRDLFALQEDLYVRQSLRLRRKAGE
jgi:hypothetical protein